MCSYCGCDAIGVVGRFMAEHVAIINATGLLREACAAADPDAVRTAADDVAELLGPHTGAEELGLFAVMRRQEEFTVHIDGLCGEHVTLDGLLERVAGGEYDLIRTFEDALRAHIDKEDNGLFPAAAIAHAGPDWDEVDALTPGAASAAHAVAGARDGHDHDAQGHHAHG